jgi:GrpB protein
VEDEASYVPAIEALRRPAALPGAGAPVFPPSELLFHDCLRADGEAQAAYVRLKREIRKRYRDDRLAYTEGKTGFVLDALDDPRTWAERTGWKLPPED